MKTITIVVSYFFVFSSLMFASLAFQGNPSPPEDAIISPKDGIKRPFLPGNFIDGRKIDQEGVPYSINDIHHSEARIQTKSLLQKKILDDTMEGNMSKEVYDLWLRVINSQRRNEAAGAEEPESTGMVERRKSITRSEVSRKARRMIERARRLSADLVDSKYGSPTSSARSGCTNFNLGVCPPNDHSK